MRLRILDPTKSLALGMFYRGVGHGGRYRLLGFLFDYNPVVLRYNGLRSHVLRKFGGFFLT